MPNVIAGDFQWQSAQQTPAHPASQRLWRRQTHPLRLWRRRDHPLRSAPSSTQPSATVCVWCVASCVVCCMSRVRMLPCLLASATARDCIIPALSVTLPSCTGGSPEGRSIPSGMASRLFGAARLPHLMSVGRSSQGGQWPLYPRPVARLVWCAPLSERGWVQHMGSMIRQE